MVVGDLLLVFWIVMAEWLAFGLLALKNDLLFFFFFCALGSSNLMWKFVLFIFPFVKLGFG